MIYLVIVSLGLCVFFIGVAQTTSREAREKRQALEARITELQKELRMSRGAMLQMLDDPDLDVVDTPKLIKEIHARAPDGSAVVMLGQPAGPIKPGIGQSTLQIDGNTGGCVGCFLIAAGMTWHEIHREKKPHQ